MKYDEFGAAADRAFAFSGALVGGVNVSTVLIHLLCAKGVLTEAEATYIFDEAISASAEMELPDPWGTQVQAVLARAKNNIV